MSRWRKRDWTPGADATARGREIGRAFAAMGFLVPILAGGNVFVVLRPDDGVALFDLATVLLAGVTLRGSVETSGVRSSTWWANAWLLLLVLWWGGTLFLRPHGPRAVLEARGIFAAALVFATLSLGRPGPRALWSFGGGLLLGTLVTALYGQYQYWIAFPRTLPLLQAAGIPAVTFVNANFYNANCYAAFLGATILLAVGMACARRGAWRWLAAVSVAPLVGTLLLSESRSAVALLVLAGIVWAALGVEPGRWRTARRSLVFRASVATSAVSLIVLIGLVDLHELWRVGLLGRISIWKASLAMIRDHWILGVGLGRFWIHFPRYQVTSYYTRYPHSFLLEIVAELGIVGGIATLGFLVAAAVAAAKVILQSRREPSCGNRWALAVPTLAGALLVAHALVDIDWHAPANAILLFSLLGFAQHLDARRGDDG